MNESSVVKEYVFNKPVSHEIDYLLDDIKKDCWNKYFHTFDFKRVFDIRVTINCINEEVNLLIGVWNLKPSSKKT